MKAIRSFRFTVLALVLTSAALASVHAAELTLAQRIVKLKNSLDASQIKLRHYEWIQTTVVTVNGNEKSRVQERCYYGADGGLQKVTVGVPTSAPRKGGISGKIQAKKAKSANDYMKRAIDLVGSYVPPIPVKLQASKDAGNASIHLLDPGKRARLVFGNYWLSGDNLGADISLVDNHLLGLTVNSYLDDPEDVVTLTVKMGRLNDGSSYPATSTLFAKRKSIQVVVTNGGYKKV